MFAIYSQTLLKLITRLVFQFAGTMFCKGITNTFIIMLAGVMESVVPGFLIKVSVSGGSLSVVYESRDCYRVRHRYVCYNMKINLPQRLNCLRF